MKKVISNKLKSYSLTAGAAVASLPTTASIIYTDVMEARSEETTVYTT